MSSSSSSSIIISLNSSDPWDNFYEDDANKYFLKSIADRTQLTWKPWFGFHTCQCLSLPIST